ncbi:MAG: HAD-IIIA family hydrolase [Chitinophagaceae bacterium]
MHEAIILAGGLGTRLRTVIQDIPKPMAEIQGKPFLSFLLDQLQFFGFNKVVLAVGYKHEYIRQFYGNQYKDLDLVYTIEDKPLGTGGAIWKALDYTTENDVLILNGDSIFLCDIHQLIDFHYEKKSMLTIALKEAENFDRYGTVLLNNENRIIEFKEKQFLDKGIFNTGIYVVNKQMRSEVKVSQQFSFEKDILEKEKNNFLFVGKIFKNYFIDIGIPEDFHKARVELVERTNIFHCNFVKKIDYHWTLFLDRDGVINKQLIGNYVREWQHFEFLPQVFEALKIFRKIFSNIIIITNQQCIGKKIVSQSAIETIHKKMKKEIEKYGGRIDAIFCSPYLELESHIDRKPNIGMAQKAKEKFPNIDFSTTIMVGDSDGDIQFAKNAGIKSVFIGDKAHRIIADMRFSSLYEFATFLLQ